MRIMTCSIFCTRLQSENQHLLSQKTADSAFVHCSANELCYFGFRGVKNKIWFLRFQKQYKKQESVTSRHFCRSCSYQENPNGLTNERFVFWSQEFKISSPSSMSQISPTWVINSLEVMTSTSMDTTCLQESVNSKFQKCTTCTARRTNIGRQKQRADHNGDHDSVGRDIQ